MYLFPSEGGDQLTCVNEMNNVWSYDKNIKKRY